MTLLVDDAEDQRDGAAVGLAVGCSKLASESNREFRATRMLSDTLGSSPVATDRPARRCSDTSGETSQRCATVRNHDRGRPILFYTAMEAARPAPARRDASIGSRK